MILQRFLVLTLFFASSHIPSAFAQHTAIAILSSAVPSSAAARADDSLARDLEARIQKSGADVAVAFRTLDGKDEWFERPDEVFHAASTMKVPVMIELFHQVREGKLKLDDPLLVKNEFHSLADGALFTLDPADDSEAE